MQNRIVILFLVLFALFIFCGAASAATVKSNSAHIVKINNVGCNDVGQYDPAMDGTRVVWIKTDSSGKSIYYKNLAFGNTVKVYQSNKEISNLDISGTRVVWQEKDDCQSSVYIKNVASGAYGKLQSSECNQYNPAISGNRVVWEEDCSIYLKNIVTGAYAKVQKTCKSQYNPDISGTRVVWQQDNADHTYVYIKNIATGQFGKYFAAYKAEPRIFGDKVLWAVHKVNGGSSGCPTYNTNVYIADLSKGQIKKVLSSAQYCYNFVISGDRIAWQEQYLINGDVYCPEYKYSVYFKNLLTGRLAKAMPSIKDQCNPAMSESALVWEQVLESGNHAIYIRDFSTGKIGPLTPSI